MSTPNNTLTAERTLIYCISGLHDPSSTATSAATGTLYIRLESNLASLYQKLDEGETTNWMLLNQSPVTGQNLGTGAQVLKNVSSNNLQFRTIKAGSNISIAQGANEITISATTGAGASTNVVTSNYVLQGTDYYVFGNSATPISVTLLDAAIDGQVYEFKNLGSGDMTLTPILGQMIDQYPNLSLRTYQALKLVTVGGQWWIF